tara:strand:- start:64 stop:690 length:627 start_codon:yes stop_codon:yes gene_type:complete
MAFINNHTDNFLPSSSPWGDDNVQVYNFPNQSSLDVSIMDYPELQERFFDLRNNFESLPPCRAKNQLKDKMISISEEMKKRNNIEEVARIERDDNFETPQRIIKEDVITPNPPLDIVLDNVDPTTPDDENPFVQETPFIQETPIMRESTLSIDDGNEILEDILDEVEEMEVESSHTIPTQASVGGKNNDMDNFLIAALVIITIIAVTK